MGLLFQGNFEEGVKQIKSLNSNSFKGINRILYLSNLLYGLLLSSQFTEASVLLNSHPELREFSTGTRFHRNQVRSTLATYEFFLGDLQKSKTEFIELVDEVLPNLAMATIYYFLGHIAIKEGNKDEADAFFVKAKELGKYTFIETELFQFNLG